MQAVISAFLKLLSILYQLVLILPTIWEIYKEWRKRKINKDVQ
jgi:hypothetical protein